MKLLKIVLLVLLVTGCANTDDVDDSDVQNDIAESQGEAAEDSEESSEVDSEVAAATPAPPAKTAGKGGAHEARGEASALLYDVASANLKKSDATLSYSVKCTYVIKPMSIKACMVKTGFLPGDAKAKIGRLLLEAKNLVRKKSGNNEASVTTNYTCTKAKIAADTLCRLDKVP